MTEALSERLKASPGIRSVDKRLETGLFETGMTKAPPSPEGPFSEESGSVLRGKEAVAQPLTYRSRASTCWGSWLAWATIALPACCRMLARDRLEVSVA